MQKHINYVYALIRNALKQLRRKMQPCRRSGGGAVFMSINGLIPALILKLLGYVRRQRHFADPIQYLFQDSVVLKLYDLVAVLKSIYDGHGKLIADPESQARFGSPSRFCKTFPSLAVNTL